MRRMAALQPRTLCPGHGGPIVDDAALIERMLCDLKPARKGLPDGTLEIDYYSVFHTLCKSNKLSNFLSSFHKLSVKSEVISNVNLFLKVFQRDHSLEQLR